MNSKTEQGGTVGKAFEILDLVAMQGKPVRFSHILSQCRYPKTTLYRILQNLTGTGMLTYDEENQTYRPGMRLLSLAHKAWREASLAPIARPIVDHLANEVGETVHLAQLDKCQVLYVDKRNTRLPIEMFSQTGKIGPAYCTGVGKAMLAFLPKQQMDEAIKQQSFYSYTPNTLTSATALRKELTAIFARGVAFDREEHEPGIICIAAPILSNGSVIGGLSITTSPSRRTIESLEEFESSLVAATREIADLAANALFPNSI